MAAWKENEYQLSHRRYGEESNTTLEVHLEMMNRLDVICRQDLLLSINLRISLFINYAP